MQVEYEVLDLTSNYVLAKSVHEGIFDDNKDSFFTSWAWIDSWVDCRTSRQIIKIRLRLTIIRFRSILHPSPFYCISRKVSGGASPFVSIT